MSYDGQVQTFGPRTMTQVVEDVNEELAELFGRAPYTVSAIGGTANSITGTIFPVPPGYPWARVVIFKPNLVNTGPVQVNWSGLGLVDLRRQDGSALANGDLSNSIYYIAIYDQVNTRYQIAGLFSIQGTGFLPLSGGTMTGPIDFADFEAQRPHIKDYSLKVYNADIVGGVCTLDYAQGNVQNIVIDENITNFVINNWPASGRGGKLELWFTQGGVGGYSVTLPGFLSGWRWPSNVIPSITPTLGRTDIVVLMTLDGGATVLASIGGQNYWST